MRLTTYVVTALFLTSTLSSAPSPATASTAGSVEGVVTWQFNESIGTKGDVDAKVILFPEHIKRKIGVGDSLIVGEIGTGVIAPDAAAIGLRGGSADGYGKVVIDNVHPGEYEALIISAATTRDVSKPVADLDVENLVPFFASKTALGKLKDSPFLKLHKSWVESITVESSQTAHFNHDFGNTFE